MKALRIERRAMHNFTPNQIAWASKHDWFAGVSPEGVAMRETVRAADGTLGNHYSVHTDIGSLRAAAGY